MMNWIELPPFISKNKLKYKILNKMTKDSLLQLDNNFDSTNTNLTNTNLTNTNLTNINLTTNSHLNILQAIIIHVFILNEINIEFL